MSYTLRFGKQVKEKVCLDMLLILTSITIVLVNDFSVLFFMFCIKNINIKR